MNPPTETPDHADHDGSYRRLFSEPAMIQDLIQGYVDEPWVQDLDFDTLERYAEARVGPRIRGRRRLETRQSDLVWRIKLEPESGAEDGPERADNWVYVFLLLEFQSEIDPHMALRILVYLGLLYQDLLRHGRGDDDALLPSVLPLVLYNGSRLWKAPRDVARLIRALPGLDRIRPRMEYLLLEETRLPEKDGNLASVLFSLERCRSPDEIDRRVGQLARLLPHAEQASLRRAFMDFLRVSLLPSRFPEAKIPHFHNLEEMRPMLRENMIEWVREAKQKAMARGLKRGLERGRQAGEASLLLRQLERRFGTLSAEVRQRVEAADAEDLLEWGERFVDAQSLGQVFDEPS